jgi:hypothetical protein
VEGTGAAQVMFQGLDHHETVTLNFLSKLFWLGHGGMLSDAIAALVDFSFCS